MEEQKEHKRRVRYKGTHPRNYNEKYKELNPEKYQGTIEHVIQKGSTPAGMHIPILVDEILDFLKIEPGQNGLDATLGYGGHSSRMLACLQGKGHLCALDVDPIEMAKTKERLAAQGYGPEILTILHQNFANIDQVAAEYGPFDFILADLGVSSMQIDNPERGFSYKYDGPLDLRLNPEAGISAAQRLRTVARDELEGMLIENADEPYAKEISQAVTRALRKGKKIDTTFALRDLIAEALDFLPKDEKKEAIKKSCARTFIHGKTSGCSCSGRQSGNSDVPFRRRPACEKVHEGTVSDRYLFRIFKRSHSSFQRRMHPQQPCKFNENALGN